MDWQSPFIVYRISADGKFKEVYHANDLKSAQYWLSYIAQPGDLCCRTPASPKHSKQSAQPEYFGHKESSGKASRVEAEWKKWAEGKHIDSGLPSEQTVAHGQARAED